MSNAVVTDWPSGSANTGWPQEPSAMLMPGRVQGWPAGTQRAANAAERLLSQAVAWWDVGQYRDGDRFLRNRGTGGELLDLRLGSSIAPNSNDPRFLAPEGIGYAYMPGVADNFLSVPDENALDITGDIDIRCRMSYESGSAGYTSFVNKQNSGARAYHFGFGGTNAVLYAIFGSGATTFVDVTSSNHGVPANTPWWFRVTRVASTGVVEFLKSPDGVTWTSISTHSLSAFSLNTNTLAMNLGGSTTSATTGKFYRAQVLSGIDGTTVLDIDCDAITSGSATSFTAVTNQTVTINRSTSGRKSVAVPSRHKGGKPVMLLGTDDYLEVQDNWQHGLLNFNQGDSFTVLAVVRQWGTTADSTFVGKRASSGTGWGMIANGTGTGAFGMQIADTTPTNAGLFNQVAYTSGTLITATSTVDRTVRTMVARNGTTSGTPVNIAAIGRLAYTGNFRVGSHGGGGYYGTIEFTAAAVFRRALSAAEIKTLSDYFTGRIA